MSSAASDVLIIGGGLAGSAAAITLARAGRNVTLIEKKSKPHHKVCGEFLSQEALFYLRELGINPIALGAVPITAVRLAGCFGVSEKSLPFPAMSLTRRRLDEELLRVASQTGVKIQSGHRVQRIAPADGAWIATLQDDAKIHAGSVFLATGKHDLLGHHRPAGRQSDLIAFKMYFRLSPAQTKELAGHIELNLYRGGYGGLQLVEDDIANFCCLIQRKTFQRLGARWKYLLEWMQHDCAHLQRRLSGAQQLLDRPMAISKIPYGFVRQHTDGMWSLGDQAAVIPSFTGDGMSIALHSGRLAAEMYLRGETPEAFQQQLHENVASQVALATFLSRGLVSRPQQTVMEAAIRLWPGLLRSVSRRTRLSKYAMQSAQRKPVASEKHVMGSY